MSHDYLFKFIITGDSSVGKTALLCRFTDQEFYTELEATVGVDFKTRNINLEDKEIMIMTWDTAGQESYRSFTRSYYRGTAIAILVYDIGNRGSFEHIPSWLQDIRNNCENPNLGIVLVGNKIDVGETSRQVEEKEGRDLADKEGLMFFETSAKSSENVQELFTNAAKFFYQKFKDGEVDFTSDSQGLTLGPGQFKKSSRCGC